MENVRLELGVTFQTEEEKDSEWKPLGPGGHQREDSLKAVKFPGGNRQFSRRKPCGMLLPGPEGGQVRSPQRSAAQDWARRQQSRTEHFNIARRTDSM